jgi:thioredoxin-related protein
MLEEIEYMYDEDELITKVIIVDTDPKGMALATEWLVSAVPTIVFIKNGEVVHRHLGNLPMSEFKNHVAGYIQRDVFSEQSDRVTETSNPVLCCPSGPEN